MCKHSQELESPTTKKIMIYCLLHENENNEMLRLCISQKYCSEKDKYIEINQKRDCKYYE